MSKRRKKVYYEVGLGWMYRFKGTKRGPFGTARQAATAMNDEAFYLRSIRRVKEGRPMTWSDKRLP